jgi:hypothetical protein
MSGAKQSPASCEPGSMAKEHCSLVTVRIERAWFVPNMAMVLQQSFA